MIRETINTTCRSARAAFRRARGSKDQVCISGCVASSSVKARYAPTDPPRSATDGARQP